MPGRVIHRSTFGEHATGPMSWHDAVVPWQYGDPQMFIRPSECDQCAHPIEDRVIWEPEPERRAGCTAPLRTATSVGKAGHGHPRVRSAVHHARERHEVDARPFLTRGSASGSLFGSRRPRYLPSRTGRASIESMTPFVLLRDVAFPVWVGAFVCILTGLALRAWRSLDER